MIGSNEPSLEKCASRKICRTDNRNAAEQEQLCVKTLQVVEQSPARKSAAKHLGIRLTSGNHRIRSIDYQNVPFTKRDVLITRDVSHGSAFLMPAPTEAFQLCAKSRSQHSV